MTTIPPAALPPSPGHGRHDEPEFPEEFELIPWADPVIDAIGFPAHHPYVELLWLPVVGPSTTWIYRRLATLAAHRPDGAAVRLDELACSVGLGSATGPTSLVQKALRRLVQFGLGSWQHGRLAVRNTVPPVSHRQLQRLTPNLQAVHRSLLGGRTTTRPALDTVSNSAGR